MIRPFTNREQIRLLNSVLTWTGTIPDPTRNCNTLFVTYYYDLCEHPGGINVYEVLNQSELPVFYGY